MSLVLQFLSVLAISVVVGGWYWLWRNFRALSLPLIVFNMTLGARTSLTANRTLWRGFRNACILRPLFAAVVVTALIWLLSDGPVQAWLRAGLAATMANPVVAFGLPATLALLGMSVLLRQDIVALWRGGVGRAGYVDATHLAVRPVRPKNLIVIQMESLEATFARADLFGRDALAPLNGLDGFSFAALKPSLGAGWTTSSMMTTLLGVPFVAPLAFARAYWRRERAFAPAATGFADILHRHGYAGVAMQGAVSGFHGFADLFRQHGFSRVLGAEHLLQRGVGAVSGWGVYDDDLFDFALDEVERLRAADAPHCLYIVTSDTHAPRGDVSPRLRRRVARPSMLDVVGYSAEMAARFVTLLAERGYLADTRVAILGDHLMPPVASLPDLSRLPGRSIYNRFIATDPPRPARGDIEQTDLAATLLTFAGFAIAGDRIGLGRSGFEAGDEVAVGHEGADVPATRALAAIWAERSPQSAARHPG